MEHRLITGGAEYLPFARSCVAKLKKLGLPYADQSHVIDGVTIRVRVEPGHEYIHIGSGSSQMAMDSGIVDVGFTYANHYQRYFPGEMIKPTSVVSYDSSFSTPSTKTDDVYVPGSGDPALPGYVPPSLITKTPYFTKSGGSAGQLSGEIKVGESIKGFIRRDGVAKSFEPQRIIEQGPPVKKVPHPADDLLVAKKLAADRCPPSMFTGRARLYAQALYGQHLYKRNSGTEDVVVFDQETGEAITVRAGNEPETSNGPPTLIELSGRAPFLQLQIHKDSDTARAAAFAQQVADEYKAAELAGLSLVYANPYDVTLNINSGVHFDQASGKHWLINPSIGWVNIMPLVSNTDGERLRKWLIPGRLSEEDRGHLEAYILSACRPHVELRVMIAVGNVNPVAYGYGWHWNWSGTRADMVQGLYNFDRNDGSTYSTHHRLTALMSYNADTKTASWTASTSVIEGPVSWATYTPICCFTHPNWINRYIGSDPDYPPVYWSEKGPWNYSPWPDMYATDAPIYAFYKGDELVVARFKTELDRINTRTVDFSLGYAQFLYPGQTPPNLTYSRIYKTSGYSGGHLYDTLINCTKKTHTITCGGESVSVVHGYLENITGSTMSEKSPGEWPVIDHSGYMSGPYSPYLLDILSGGPPAYPFEADGSAGYAHNLIPGPVYASYESYQPSTYTQRDWSSQKYPVGVSGAIIPFYDAEAFYLIQNTSVEDHQTSVTENSLSGFFAGRAYSYDIHGSITGTYDRLYWNVPAGGSGTYNAPDYIDVTNVIETTKAITKVGTISMNLVSGEAMSMFEDGDSDYISATFKTLSNTSSTTLIMTGLVEYNWPNVTMVRPVIVGWA